MKTEPQKTKKKTSSKLTKHRVKQGSEAWHKLREGRVTASNAWKLLTKGKEVAMRRDITPDNHYMRRGRELEPEAIELYERIYDVKVKTVGFITNSDYPDAGYSPDGMLKNKLIEVKCFGKDKHLSIYQDTVPPEVMAQVQFGMMIAEESECDLVLYNPDLDPIDAIRIITIQRDDKIITNIKLQLKGDN